MTIIGLLTPDPSFQQAVEVSMTDVMASYFTFSTVDQLEHQQLDVLLWDDRRAIAFN